MPDSSAATRPGEAQVAQVAALREHHPAAVERVRLARRRCGAQREERAEARIRQPSEAERGDHLARVAAHRRLHPDQRPVERQPWPPRPRARAPRRAARTPCAPRTPAPGAGRTPRRPRESPQYSSCERGDDRAVAADQVHRHRLLEGRRMARSARAARAARGSVQTDARVHAALRELHERRGLALDGFRARPSAPPRASSRRSRAVSVPVSASRSAARPAARSSRSEARTCP